MTKQDEKIYQTMAMIEAAKTKKSKVEKENLERGNATLLIPIHTSFHAMVAKNSISCDVPRWL